MAGVKFGVVMRHRLLVLLALFVVAFGSYGLDTSSDLQLPKDHYLLAISGDRRLWFKKGVVTVEELERNLVGMRRVGRPITLVVALDARIDKNGLFYLDLQRMLSSVDSKMRLIDVDTFRSNLTSKSSG